MDVIYQEIAPGIWMEQRLTYGVGVNPGSYLTCWPSTGSTMDVTRPVIPVDHRAYTRGRKESRNEQVTDYRNR